MKRATTGIAIASLLVAGCYQGADAGANEGSAGDSASDTATAGGTEGGAGDSEGEAAVGASPLRRLSHVEYDNTVQDLLDVALSPSSDFPAESAPEAGFSNAAAQQQVSPVLAERYLQAAETLAAAADLSALVPCPLAEGDRACAEAFIAQFGLRAYRRPLSGSEVSTLLEIFDETTSDAGFETGVRLIIQALLISPHFLYRVEIGMPQESTSSSRAVALTSYEMASRLSYLLWGSMPDDALFEAAANDELRDPAEVERHARRLLADPRARDTLRRFYLEWLALDLEGVSKSDAFPEFDDELRASMDAQTQTFVDWVLWKSDARLQTFLTSSVSFADARLAELYGITAPPDGIMQRVELDPAQRAGILTHPSLLAKQSQANQSDPIHRGKLVRERLLCQTLPSPPPDVMPIVPDVDPSLPTRERFDQHASDPACAGCHELMDPIGFGFEHYDPVGRFRTHDGEHVVDASGELVGTDVDGTFYGVPELAAKLAASAQVQACVVKQWFRFGFGRSETDDDAEVVAQLEAAFAHSEHDLVDLVVALTQTDAFMTRRAVEESP